MAFCLSTIISQPGTATTTASTVIMVSSATMSTRLFRKSIPLKPGRFSTFSSMAKPALQGIPHPSSFPIKDLEDPKTFSSPSRPRVVYARPEPKTKELPQIPVRWPVYLGLGVLGISIWGAVVLYAGNQERLSSSVVRQFLLKLKSTDNPQLRSTLGDNINPEPTWFMGGHPYVDGQINMLKGHVDVSLRIRGSKGAGTVYFTSIRREKGAPFSILRFKVICDDGTIISLAENVLDSSQ